MVYLGLVWILYHCLACYLVRKLLQILSPCVLEMMGWGESLLEIKAARIKVKHLSTLER